MVADISACSPACAVGPARAQLGPPGSFANSGHDAAHAHMVQTDPAGRFVIANDLGLDRTLIWAFDSTAGKLLNPRSVPSSAGAGPRHFAFHPNRRWFYSLNEESSTIAVMSYDETTGALVPVQEVSTLPAGFTGTSHLRGQRVRYGNRLRRQPLHNLSRSAASGHWPAATAPRSGPRIPSTFLQRAGGSSVVGNHRATTSRSSESRVVAPGHVHCPLVPVGARRSSSFARLT